MLHAGGPQAPQGRREGPNSTGSHTQGGTRPPWARMTTVREATEPAPPAPPGGSRPARRATAPGEVARPAPPATAWRVMTPPPTPRSRAGRGAPSRAVQRHHTPTSTPLSSTPRSLRSPHPRLPIFSPPAGPLSLAALRSRLPSPAPAPPPTDFGHIGTRCCNCVRTLLRGGPARWSLAPAQRPCHPYVVRPHHPWFRRAVSRSRSARQCPPWRARRAPCPCPFACLCPCSPAPNFSHEKRMKSGGQ